MKKTGMLKHMLTLGCLLAASVLPAQNLVKNGGFESYKKLPDSDGCFNGYIKDWSNLNGKEHYPNGTPDFLHRQGTGNGDVDNYYYAKVDPYKGDAMMGVIVMPGRPFYEYVSTDVPLEKGKRYELSLHITNGPPKYCGCSGRGFGIYFSDKLPHQDVAERVDVKPQWKITDDFYTERWEQISFRFTAPADFKQMTIGYFGASSELNMKPLNGSSDCIYFFVDEISVTEVKDAKTGMEVVSLPESVKNVASELGAEPAAIENPVPTKPVATAHITVVEKGTGKPLDAKLSVIDLRSNIELWAGDLSAAQPSADVRIPDPSGTYGIFAQSKGFVDASGKMEPITLVRDTVMDRPILLSPIRKGETIVLKNIYFDSGKYDLLPTSFAELDKLVAFLKDNPKLKIEISGHTDHVGSDAANQLLSEHRAQAVLDYVAKQVDKGRLTYKGYGESVPVAKNDTEDGRQKNRRVEFKIL